MGENLPACGVLSIMTGSSWTEMLLCTLHYDVGRFCMVPGIPGIADTVVGCMGRLLIFG